METKHVNKYLKELITCTQCGYCKEVCPVFDDLGWDSAAARGKVALAYGLYMGDIEPDDSVLERLLQCTTCEDCKRRCPSKTEVVKAIEAIRKDLNEAGFSLDIHKKIVENIKAHKNPYGETAGRSEVLGESPKQAEIAYFAGCTATYRNNEISKAALSILKKLGVNYTVLDEVCCGSVLRRTGFSDDIVKELVDANIKAIEATGAKKVLFSCAGCLAMIRKEYKEFRDFEFEPLHFTEWLADQDLNLKAYPKKVTYHDPCHIGRHLDQYDAPRKLIESIPEIDFEEMENIKAQARCCGGGGGVRSAYPELSKAIAENRLKQAGFAEVLLSTCPFCLNTLRFSNEDLKQDIEIRDVLQLVDELLE
jgi:Fe-S oxidoreductase